MVKSIKAGLSTLGVFALMMTVAPQAGAQEQKVDSGKDKVEVSKSVEVQLLAGTAQQLKAEFAQLAQNRVEAGAEKLPVMKEPNFSDEFKGIERALVDTYFEFTGTPGEDESDPEMWSPSTPGGCSGSNASCKILVKSAYVGASPARILLSEIDVVDGSPGNQIPNPTQAGPNPSQPFVSIHNQP